MDTLRNIRTDYKSVKGKFNKYTGSAGRAGEVLRKDFDNQLVMAIKECGFKYLRFHGLFHDEMAVYNETDDGVVVYNWQYVDVVFDSLIEKGIKPFIELSFMPKDLASGDQTVFWWKSNVTPPKDYNLWYDFINYFIVHIEKRYSKEEILTWYFEVWNEPNHSAFLSGDMAEYFKLYDVMAKAIKDVCQSYYGLSSF